MHFVGWESAAIGNHQVVFVRRAAGSSLLVDPTLGLIAPGTFDEVASGAALRAGDMRLFDPRPELEAFERLVLCGLTGGLLRASELLYYFDDPDHLEAAFRDPRAWPTPGAIAWRKRNP